MDSGFYLFMALVVLGSLMVWANLQGISPKKKEETPPIEEKEVTCCVNEEVLNEGGEPCEEVFSLEGATLQEIEEKGILGDIPLEELSKLWQFDRPLKTPQDPIPAPPQTKIFLAEEDEIEEIDLSDIWSEVDQMKHADLKRPSKTYGVFTADGVPLKEVQVQWDNNGAEEIPENEVVKMKDMGVRNVFQERSASALKGTEAIRDFRRGMNQTAQTQFGWLDSAIKMGGLLGVVVSDRTPDDFMSEILEKVTEVHRRNLVLSSNPMGEDALLEMAGDVNERKMKRWLCGMKA